MTRPDKHQYFADIATVVSTRSSCLRRKVGAVLVRDGMVLSTGYNGTARGAKNCDEGGCERCASNAPSGTALGDCQCLHAEENAVLQAAMHGVNAQGSTLYTTLSPCRRCVRFLKNAGITTVYCSAAYSDFETAKAEAASLQLDVTMNPSARPK